MAVDRLTKPDGDYCRDICGQARFCVRYHRGDICFNSRCYERLRIYENTGVELDSSPHPQADSWKEHYRKRFNSME